MVRTEGAHEVCVGMGNGRLFWAVLGIVVWNKEGDRSHQA